MADVEIQVKVKHSSPKAYLCVIGEGPRCDEEEWIPKSKVSDYCADEVNGEEVITSLFIPEWLATEKGLV